ncbi:MAG: class F sortase, partial [Geodermatophilaceae bacterium]|nr:class F sortase [Geodermatophilaceae bacterium]
MTAAWLPHYRNVGWWKDGPLPGTSGNAIVGGHVDSETGPAVFYGLVSLQRSDQIMVNRRNSVHSAVRSARVERF